MAIIMDKYILGEDEGFCFNQIKKADFEVMNSLYWSEFNETYPNGNGWNFNPRTKNYFAFFMVSMIVRKDSMILSRHSILLHGGQNGTDFINLKISNKSAFLESENGKKIYEFENSDHILFLAEHSYYLKQRMSINGYSLLQSYYK